MTLAFKITEQKEIILESEYRVEGDNIEEIIEKLRKICNGSLSDAEFVTDNATEAASEGIVIARTIEICDSEMGDEEEIDSPNFSFEELLDTDIEDVKDAIRERTFEI